MVYWLTVYLYLKNIYCQILIMDFAPKWWKLKMSKTKIRKLQAQYAEARESYKDTSEEELLEKEKEVEDMDDLLDWAF